MTPSPDCVRQPEQRYVVHIADVLVLRVYDDVRHLMQGLERREQSAASAVGAQPRHPVVGSRPAGQQGQVTVPWSRRGQGRLTEVRGRQRSAEVIKGWRGSR